MPCVFLIFINKLLFNTQWIQASCYKEVISQTDSEKLILYQTSSFANEEEKIRLLDFIQHELLNREVVLLDLLLTC